MRVIEWITEAKSYQDNLIITQSVREGCEGFLAFLQVIRRAFLEWQQRIGRAQISYCSDVLCGPKRHPRMP